MIGAPLRQTFLRVLTPRWAHQPMSGAGAALTGGRFNRVGQEALYLSAEIDTAWAEYQQTGSIPRPGLVAGYLVEAESVVDSRDDNNLAALGIVRADLTGDWRYLLRIRHQEPASWPVVDRLIARGAQGLLFPSAVRPTGTNLVLWRTTTPARVTVFDPHGDLPRDAASW